MTDLKTIKKQVSENLIESKHYITITTSHKYGIEKTSQIKAYLSETSKQINFVITNTDTCTSKDYENETSFYNAIKRLLKKQVNN